ncbi:MerR family transcriptional regulator [Limimonas halophila]|uniref:MerR family transcriptional regulator n=1 Tax=Limimonas halophila TaxID=1082479 RepID=UPI00316ABD34
MAEELQLPQHVLRFWETKFDEVQPLKRGGGRRYYRPEDIDLLRRIRDLLYSDGYTIKDVQQFLEDGQIEVPRNLRRARQGGRPQSDRGQTAQGDGEGASGGTDASSAPAELDASHRHELEQVLAELTAARDELRRAGLDAGD